MLLCGIIDELSPSTKLTDKTASMLLSYFFCRATDARINNATAVLRSLIYLLVDQQPPLISHVRKKYDPAGKQLFEDVNAWVVLSEIFTSILEDPNLRSAYLIIDALDECLVDLPLLLALIVQKSSVYSRVKWIVSSRNWPSTEERLDTATQKIRLCLELNEKSISAAVSTYIQYKVDRLAERKKYNKKTRDAVQHHLSSNANNTFLWVALVCQNLEKISSWNTLAKLDGFPPGLDSLYERMVEYICSLEDADDVDLCKRILAIVKTVYRPITLKELPSFVEMPEGVSDNLEALEKIIGLCGSFLTLRERIIYFVHQSAKDFLLTKTSSEIFHLRIEEEHHTIFSRSLQVMSDTLSRDIYGLHSPGFPIDQVKQPEPDPLAAARYSCVYWVDHLGDCDPSRNANDDLQDSSSIDQFLCQSYLHWLEALSLLKSMPEGILSMAKLEGLLQVSFNQQCDSRAVLILL
jgi:hypothetical protein